MLFLSHVHLHNNEGGCDLHAALMDGKMDCAALLRRAIELREEESGNQYKSMLKRALRYIDQNYTDENLSLNAVAKAANISPNYFSGVFSQEMGQTFVEYGKADGARQGASALFRKALKRGGLRGRLPRPALFQFPL